jgi:hypothetical protein
MTTQDIVIAAGKVEGSILLVRGQRVVLDSELAALYGVTTKRLNQQVQRNLERFPDDFMFQLAKSEKEQVVANCNHLSKLRFDVLNVWRTICERL